MIDSNLLLLRDPRRFQAALWPKERIYKEQWDIVDSVEHNIETYVVAANQVGKDYIAAFIILWFFLMHHPCKIVTTSAVAKHLMNLWGEMDRWIRTAAVPLTHDKGGPLVYNHFLLRKQLRDERGGLYVPEDIYCVAMVVTNENKGEGMSGHHSANTLAVFDEASGVSDLAYRMAQGWAARFLIFGNPNESNGFFREGIEAGDLAA